MHTNNTQYPHNTPSEPITQSQISIFLLMDCVFNYFILFFIWRKRCMTWNNRSSCLRFFFLIFSSIELGNDQSSINDTLLQSVVTCGECTWCQKQEKKTIFCLVYPSLVLAVDYLMARHAKNHYLIIRWKYNPIAPINNTEHCYTVC